MPPRPRRALPQFIPNPRGQRFLFLALLVALVGPMLAIDGLGRVGASEERGLVAVAAVGRVRAARSTATTVTTASTSTTTSPPPTTTSPPPTTAPPSPVSVLHVSEKFPVATTEAPSTTTPSTTAPPATAPPTTRPPVAPPGGGGAATHGSQRGTATWYRDGTANGCAHLTLPFGTVVTVTAVDSGRSVTCVVDDRGPFGGHIIDLSPGAFSQLASLSSGVVESRITW